MINNFHFQNFRLRNDGTRTLSLFAQLNDRELVIDLDSARCMILGLRRGHQSLTVAGSDTDDETRQLLQEIADKLNGDD